MRKSIITSALLLASLISCNTTTQLSNEELDRISWSASARTSAITNRPTVTTSKPSTTTSMLGAAPCPRKRHLQNSVSRKATKPCPTSSANPASSPTTPSTDVTAPCSTATLSTQKSLHVQTL